MYDYLVDSKEIGLRLRQHRVRAPKISLSKLAKESKALTASGISNYETGIRRLKVREAKILSEAFTRLGRPISAAQLVGIEDGKESSQDALQVYFPKEAYQRLARLVALWAFLTDDAQAELLNSVERLADSAQYGQRPPSVRLRSNRKEKARRN